MVGKTFPSLAASIGLAAISCFFVGQNGFADSSSNSSRLPLVIKTQGSFEYGGTTITGSNGDTFHGDHGYVQYQIPLLSRTYPIVMWHGGGQFSKTWETTPDGREGYQNILLRQGFSTYILDQPRRGRAGRGTLGTTIPDAVPGEASTFNIFRLGIWTPPTKPKFFSGVQFPQDANSIDQYWRQQAPNTGPENFDSATREFQSAQASKLFDKIGPSILITHSNSGQYGWRTAMRNKNVKAIVAYEPGTYAFPAGKPPAAVPTADASVAAITAPDLVPDADFNQLTKIPIQIVYGDNIDFDTPSPIMGVELWRVNTQRATQFVNEINKRGGHAEILYLPKAGLKGNTHFAFSDLNNLKVAGLLFQWLNRNKLDGFAGRRDLANN